MLRMSALRAAAEVLHGSGVPASELTAYAEALATLAACDRVQWISLEYAQPGHTPELLRHCGDKGVVLGALDLAKPAVERPEVDAFVRFYLENAAALSEEVGYIPLPDEAYQLVMERYEQRKTGSVFQGVEVGVSIEEVLRREQ